MTSGKANPSLMKNEAYCPLKNWQASSKPALTWDHTISLSQFFYTDAFPSLGSSLTFITSSFLQHIQYGCCKIMELLGTSPVVAGHRNRQIYAIQTCKVKRVEPMISPALA
jgi:hypothetical protein